MKEKELVPTNDVMRTKASIDSGGHLTLEHTWGSKHRVIFGLTKEQVDELRELLNEEQQSWLTRTPLL